MTGEAAAAFRSYALSLAGEAYQVDMEWMLDNGKMDDERAAFLAGWEARGKADKEVAYRTAFDVDMDGDEEVSEVLVNKILTAIRSLDTAPAAEGKEGGDGR